MYIDNQSKSNYSFGQYIYMCVWPKQGGDRILSVDKLTSHAAWTFNMSLCYFFKISKNMLFFFATMQWHRLLKTTGLTKRCFMSLLPFQWLTRHIITNYIDRLSSTKPPWQLTPAISNRADRSIWCVVIHLSICWNLLINLYSVSLNWEKCKHI